VAGTNTGGTWFWDNGGPTQIINGVTEGNPVRDYLIGMIPTVMMPGHAKPFDRPRLVTRIDFGGVTDGLSNTAMFTERHTPSNGQTRRRTFWSSIPANHLITASPLSATIRSHDWETCIRTCGRSAADEQRNYCGRGAGSYHPGGLNVALGDVSVRFISDNINCGSGWDANATELTWFGIWGALCAAQSGQSVNLP
jgi:hypothetical protein